MKKLKLVGVVFYTYGIFSIFLGSVTVLQWIIDSHAERVEIFGGASVWFAVHWATRFTFWYFLVTSILCAIAVILKLSILRLVRLALDRRWFTSKMVLSILSELTK